MTFAFAPPLSLLPVRPTTSSTAKHRCKSTPRADWCVERTNPPPSVIWPDDPSDVSYWKSLPGVQLAHPLPLTLCDILSLAKGETSDDYPTEIVRLLLGWRLQSQQGGRKWATQHVRPAWLESYPDTPPDFIGDPNDYSREKDLPVKTAVQRLQRSIYPQHKNAFREVLKPAGFPGWKVKDLTPNRTRRAVCTSYILFWYRVHYPDWKWE